MEWYIADNGKTHGPFATEVLKQFVAQGRIKPTMQVRRGSDGQWFPSAKLNDLLESKIAVPPVVPPSISDLLAAPPKNSKTRNVPSAKRRNRSNKSIYVFGGIIFVLAASCFFATPIARILFSTAPVATSNSDIKATATVTTPPNSNSKKLPVVSNERSKPESVRSRDSKDQGLIEALTTVVVESKKLDANIKKREELKADLRKIEAEEKKLEEYSKELDKRKSANEMAQIAYAKMKPSEQAVIKNAIEKGERGERLDTTELALLEQLRGGSRTIDSMLDSQATNAKESDSRTDQQRSKAIEQQKKIDEIAGERYARLDDHEKLCVNGAMQKAKDRERLNATEFGFLQPFKDWSECKPLLDAQLKMVAEEYENLLGDPDHEMNAYIRFAMMEIEQKKEFMKVLRWAKNGDQLDSLEFKILQKFKGSPVVDPLIKAQSEMAMKTFKNIGN